jgi:hypothetical protein
MTAAYFEDHPTDLEKVILRKPPLDQGADYERGFVDGMQYQMQSSVDKAVNAMSQRTWVGLAKEDRLCAKYMQDAPEGIEAVIDYIESKLKELNT